VDDLAVYEAPFKNKSRVIICAYDIFGFHENTKEVCDRLAEQGDFRVVLPDFYHGDYWREDRPTQLMYSWFNYTCSWEDARSNLKTLIQHYKEDGATSFGIFGFCWGGKISVLAGTELPDIKCIGLVHPSGVKTTEANKVKCPVIILPSSEEHDLMPFRNIIVDRLGEDACVHHKFENMKHGFCAARGDFTDPATKQAVGEVIDHLDSFFNAHMPHEPQLRTIRMIWTPTDPPHHV